CFFRIHVNFAGERRIVGADRQQRDFDIVTLADLPEAFEIRGVSTMKDRAPVRSNDKAAESAMRIAEEPRAPMGGPGKANSERPKLDRLQFIELVEDVEAEPMHETPHSNRNDNWLICRNRAQSPTIEMIKMRVGDENEIN